MEINEKIENDVLIFMLSGRLDSNTSPAFEERIIEAVAKGSHKLVIDFGALEYISSAGLRVINKTVKQLRPNNGKLILCSMQDYVREVFEIAGFDSFIPIVPSPDDAMGKF